MSTVSDNSNVHDQRRAADHESFLSHRKMRWAKIAASLSGIFFLGYLLIDQQPRPNGGSWYGYFLGTVGFGLIIWLSWLGVRKRKMTEGHWSLKAWTSAHVYLGLSLLVIGTLHTGFQLGWNVHTLAWVLMVIVIISGIYGVAAYATLPSRLSATRKEMTRSQMVEALDAINRQLEQAAQPLDRYHANQVVSALQQDPFGASVITRLTGSYKKCATSKALEELSDLNAAKKDQLGPEAKVISLLQKRAVQLSQIRKHMRVKALLEIWLLIHVPATAALIATLIAHVISVFYYWG